MNDDSFVYVLDQLYKVHPFQVSLKYNEDNVPTFSFIHHTPGTKDSKLYLTQ